MRNLLSQALASAADGAFVVDTEQRIVYWNRAAERILGHSPKILGRPCYEVLHGEDSRGRIVCDRRCSVAMTAFRGDGVPNFDVSVRTASGDLCWINVSTFVFPSNAESEHFIVHLFRDVTRRKQTEALLYDLLAAAGRLREESLSRGIPQAPAAGPATELTEREYEVLSLLVRGSSTTDMARALSISTSTVRNHIRNILLKFQVHSRIEAVLYAVKQGLIALD